MLKLNNKGWGFSAFIAFIAVFFIAIILISIGAIRLGISSKQDVSKLPVTEVSPRPTHNPTSSDLSTNIDDYTDVINNYKNQLIDGTKSYIKDTNTSIALADTFTITVVALVRDNYISKLEIKGNTCTGYVTVFNNSGTYEYKSLLSCGNGYVTESYDAALDESF